MTKELANNIVLLRNRLNDGSTIDPLLSIQTINALVELVAEMESAATDLYYCADCDENSDRVYCYKQAKAKAAPIAELKESLSQGARYENIGGEII